MALARRRNPPEETVPVRKPTYYFDSSGKEISYVDHSHLIERDSWEGGLYRVYPMYKFVDAGTHFEVHCVAERYEYKPKSLKVMQELIETGEFVPLKETKPEHWSRHFDTLELPAIELCLKYEDMGGNFPFPNAGLMKIIAKLVRLVEGLTK